MGYGRLTERKVRYIVRQKQRGKSNKEIAFEMRVSVQVKRVWSYWLTHKEYLPIRKRGRKVKERGGEGDHKRGQSEVQSGSKKKK